MQSLPTRYRRAVSAVTLPSCSLCRHATVMQSLPSRYRRAVSAVTLPSCSLCRHATVKQSLPLCNRCCVVLLIVFLKVFLELFLIAFPECPQVNVQLRLVFSCTLVYKQPQVIILENDFHRFAWKYL